MAVRVYLCGSCCVSQCVRFCTDRKYPCDDGPTTTVGRATGRGRRDDGGKNETKGRVYIMGRRSRAFATDKGLCTKPSMRFYVLEGW